MSAIACRSLWAEWSHGRRVTLPLLTQAQSDACGSYSSARDRGPATLEPLHRHGRENRRVLGQGKGREAMELGGGAAKGVRVNALISKGSLCRLLLCC